MTELALPTGGGLAEQMQYAKALAGANLLPKQYRGEPANLLLAMELGRSLGLPLAQILVGVNVVEGKPALGAELMAALGRKAGHRIRVSGDDQTATCSIWRADDPEFEYRSVWTIQRAADSKLCTLKDGRPVARSRDGKALPWELFPASMLKARATSEACRAAIPDVLSGMAYVPEELQPQYVDADPPPPPIAVKVTSDVDPVKVAGQILQAMVPKQRKPRKASTPDSTPDVVEADTQPSMSPEPEQPSTQTGEPDVTGPLEAAEAQDWRAGWLDQLDMAMQNKDLDAVQSLGTEAAREGADDLVEQARDAWSIVSGR